MKKRIVTLVFGIIVLCTVKLIGIKTYASEKSSIAKLQLIDDVVDFDIDDGVIGDLNFDIIKEISRLIEVEHTENLLTVNLFSDKMIIRTKSKSSPQEFYTNTHRFGVTGLTQLDYSNLSGSELLLTEGSGFDEIEINCYNYGLTPVIISNEFAEDNQLSIGSRFSLKNEIYNIPMELEFSEVFVKENQIANKEYAFIVIGKFMHSEDSSIVETDILVPDLFVRDAWHYALLTEHNNFVEKGLHDAASHYLPLLDKERMFQNPRFILTDGADIEHFKSLVNEILVGHGLEYSYELIVYER